MLGTGTVRRAGGCGLDPAGRPRAGRPTHWSRSSRSDRSWPSPHGASIRRRRSGGSASICSRCRMVICVALACWEPLATAARAARGWWRADSVPSRVGAGLLCASLTIGLPVTVMAMSNPRIGNQQLQYGLKSLVYPEDYPPSEQWYRRLMVNDRSLAQYFDRKNLPVGSVLMDTFNTLGYLAGVRTPEAVRHHQRLRLLPRETERPLGHRPAIRPRPRQSGHLELPTP